MTKNSWNNLIPLLTASFLIRLSGLWLVFPQKDEAWEIHGALQVLQNPFSHPEYYGNPPLLAYILTPLTFFGVKGPEIRILAALLSTFHVYVTYLILREHFNDKIGFTVAFILTFMPAHISTGQIISRDLFLMLFSTIAVYFYSGFLSGPVPMEKMVLCSAFTTLSILSKESGVILLIFFLVSLFILSWRSLRYSNIRRRITNSLAKTLAMMRANVKNLTMIYTLPVVVYLMWKTWATLNNYKYIYYGGYPPAPDAPRYTLLEAWQYYHGNPLSYLKIIGWEYCLIVLGIFTAIVAIDLLRLHGISYSRSLGGLLLVAILVFIYRYLTSGNPVTSFLYGFAFAIGSFMVIRLFLSTFGSSSTFLEVYLGTWALAWLGVFTFYPKIEITYLLPILPVFSVMIAKDESRIPLASKLIKYVILPITSIIIIVLSYSSGDNALHFIWSLLAKPR